MHLVSVAHCISMARALRILLAWHDRLYKGWSPGGVMKFRYEPCHVLQDVLFFLTGAVRSSSTLALAHAHSSSGGVEAEAQLPAENHHVILSAFLG